MFFKGYFNPVMIFKGHFNLEKISDFRVTLGMISKVCFTLPKRVVLLLSTQIPKVFLNVPLAGYSNYDSLMVAISWIFSVISRS